MSKLTVYKASAGSGKTYRLVAEYIKMLVEKPQAYREILAVTFTNKATAEMKRRIVQNLFEMKAGSENALLNTLATETQKDKEYIRKQATTALSYILHDYSMFSISTIDSFVQRIVQNLLWEMGQHGNNNLVIDEKPYIQRAADMLLDNLTSYPELLEHVKRTLEEKLNENESPRIQEDLLNLGSMLFLEDYKMLSEDERHFMHDKANLDRLRAEVQRIITVFHEQVTQKAAEILRLAEQRGYYNSSEKDTYKNFFRQNNGIFPFILKVSELKRGSMIEMSEYAGNALNVINTWLTKDTAKQNDLVKFVEGTLMPVYKVLYNCINQNLLLYNTAIAINKNLPTLYIINDLHSTLREKLKDEGVMLLSDSGTLLKEFVSQTDTPFIYEKIGTRYSSYMLDEFQDTSQLQWRNFEPLISDSLGSGGFSMVVGDVKQSIYRWRNSDWRIMANIENHPQFKTEVKRLSVNRRSAKMVVEFNNHFFRNAVDWLKGKAESGMSAISSSFDIENLYSDIKQECQESKIDGYVEVSFLPPRANDQNDALRDHIKNILIDLKNRGYKPGDIAFLVRKNRQGAEIAEMLLSIKHTESALADYINIVSQEALTLNSSAAVRLCMSALRIALNPNDSMAKALLQKEFATLQGSEIQWADIFEADYTNDFEWLKSIRYYPLGGMVELVIEHFGLNKHEQHLPYLAMLHEEAIRFSYRGTSSLSRFLEWYDEQGWSQKLFMAKVENAINILSIHKSKGLEFPVVIFPDADLLNQRNPNDGIKWFKLPQTLYDEKPNEVLWNYPLYPVKPTKDLVNTFFREDYLKEQLYKKIDDINLQYVAFTRAERELYLIVLDKELAKKVGSSENELEKVVSQNQFAGFLPNFNGDFFRTCSKNTVTYSYGKKQSKEEKKALNKTEQRSITGYPIHEKKNIIAHQFNYQRAGAKTKDGLQHGIAMHAILSKVFTVSDIPLAIDWAVQNGYVALNESNTITQKIESMLSAEPFSTWFSGNWNVKTEVAVIDVGGKTNRPDRVLLGDDEVLIIDFKFGMPLEKHRSQVTEYVKLIKKMGYTNVRGYLWYPELNRVDTVAV